MNLSKIFGSRPKFRKNSATKKILQIGKNFSGYLVALIILADCLNADVCISISIDTGIVKAVSINISINKAISKILISLTNHDGDLYLECKHIYLFYES